MLGPEMFCFSPVKWDCYKGQYSGQLGLEPGDLSLRASCLEERLMGYLLILEEVCGVYLSLKERQVVKGYPYHTLLLRKQMVLV